MHEMVGTARFELATPGSQSRCAPRLRHVPCRGSYRRHRTVPSGARMPPRVDALPVTHGASGAPMSAGRSSVGMLPNL